jgi:anti-sigma regulatory factor (Ser/Thr protein kinase)
VVEGNPLRVSFELQPEVESVGLARRVLRAAFGTDVPERTLMDLLTVVSELVTNAVIHGPRKPIHLAVSLNAEDGVLRGEVVDQGDPEKSLPRIREANREKGGGFGLRLVDVMTSQWAVLEGSTTVAFEIPVDGQIRSGYGCT